MSQPAVQIRSRLPRLATQIREEAVARARLTVVPRKRQKAAKVPFVALVSLMLLGGVIGLLLFNTSMQQASFAATALQDQADTLAAREQTLRMEMDSLRDPQRIAEQAQRMGMVPAASATFLELKTGKILGGGTRAVPLPPLRINPPVPARPRPLISTSQSASQSTSQSTSQGASTGAATHGSGTSTGHDGSHVKQQHQQQQSFATARPNR
jgi:cell division protein FtsB